jgi:hypothetical protein
LYRCDISFVDLKASGQIRITARFSKARGGFTGSPALNEPLVSFRIVGKRIPRDALVPISDCAPSGLIRAAELIAILFVTSVMESGALVVGHDVVSIEELF